MEIIDAIVMFILIGKYCEVEISFNSVRAKRVRMQLSTEVPSNTNSVVLTTREYLYQNLINVKRPKPYYGIQIDRIRGTIFLSKRPFYAHALNDQS